jgi:hypothetical protein
MNPYVLLGSRVGTSEAASLSERLAAWHDSMVAHERRLRIARTDDLCNEECPHGEARILWAEAVAMFGDRASELRFLQSRAMTAGVAETNGVSHVTARADGTNAGCRSNVRSGLPVANSRHPLPLADASPSRTLEI